MTRAENPAIDAGGAGDQFDWPQRRPALTDGSSRLQVYGDPERIRTADLHLDRVAC